ncbi:MAG: hypothetical protein NT070_19630 [Cyanobacteria bacterium]|nr:hypothetical protein [Cyanobacteriota bacterium]
MYTQLTVRTSNADALSLIRQAHDESWEELHLSGMDPTDLSQDICC